MEGSETAYCNQCRRDVQYHFDPVKHRKQILLTIISFGLWLPVWMCIAFSPTKLCNACNGPIWDGGT